jgi:hypothetical protein
MLSDCYYPLLLQLSRCNSAVAIGAHKSTVNVIAPNHQSILAELLLASTLLAHAVM